MRNFTNQRKYLCVERYEPANVHTRRRQAVESARNWFSDQMACISHAPKSRFETDRVRPAKGWHCGVVLVLGWLTSTRFLILLAQHRPQIYKVREFSWVNSVSKLLLSRFYRGKYLRGKWNSLWSFLHLHAPHRPSKSNKTRSRRDRSMAATFSVVTTEDYHRRRC